jgi:hypothetical protein
MPTFPGILMTPVFGMVFQAGMENQTRTTKQEKKTGACVTHFVPVFTFFLSELGISGEISFRER